MDDACAHEMQVSNAMLNTRVLQKVHKEQGITSPNMSPRGEGPLTKQIRAHLGGEKRPKPISNKLQMAQNFAGPI